jgi:hypothetical protein
MWGRAHMTPATTVVRIRFTRGKTADDFVWWAQMEMTTTGKDLKPATNKILFAGDSLDDLTGPKFPGDKPIKHTTAYLVADTLKMKWGYSRMDYLHVQRVNENGWLDAQYYFTASTGNTRAYQENSFTQHFNLAPEETTN